MFYREANSEAAGPPLLFIHGLGESGLCFEHLLSAPQLKGHRLLIPDLPGYGRSPWPEGLPLGLVDQADHLAGWLRGRQAVPAVIIGHSMGGVVALLLAERHPDVVSGVIDIDGNKSPGDCVFSSQAGQYDLDTFAAAGFDQMRARIHDKGYEDTAQRGYYVSLRLADPRTYHRNSLELVEMSGRRDMAQRLAALAVPAVYIAGVPDGASVETHELLAQAQVPVVAIEPSGHWPFIDQTAHFLVALTEILAEE
jgi:pimeloyl-ACP methyl ester carboxylesterase